MIGNVVENGSREGSAVEIQNLRIPDDKCGVNIVSFEFWVFRKGNSHLSILCFKLPFVSVLYGIKLVDKINLRLRNWPYIFWSDFERLKTHLCWLQIDNVGFSVCANEPNFTLIVDCEDCGLVIGIAMNLNICIIIVCSHHAANDLQILAVSHKIGRLECTLPFVFPGGLIEQFDL